MERSENHRPHDRARSPDSYRLYHLARRARSVGTARVLAITVRAAAAWVRSAIALLGRPAGSPRRPMGRGFTRPAGGGFPPDLKLRRRRIAVARGA